MYNYPGIQIRYVYCWVLGGHLNTVHKCSNQEFEMFILYLWTKFSRCLYGLNRMCASLNNVIWTSGVTTVNSGQQSLMIKSTIGCFMLSFVHLYFSCDAELYIYIKVSSTGNFEDTPFSLSSHMCLSVIFKMYACI